MNNRTYVQTSCKNLGALCMTEKAKTHGWTRGELCALSEFGKHQRCDVARRI